MNKESRQKILQNGCHCSFEQINARGENHTPSEEEIIEQGFEQMEMLYKSRCVAMSGMSNVTVTEIKKQKNT
ncbi:hypothetical protein [Desulfomarina sp.]